MNLTQITIPSIRSVLGDELSRPAFAPQPAVMDGAIQPRQRLGPTAGDTSAPRALLPFGQQPPAPCEALRLPLPEVPFDSRAIELPTPGPRDISSLRRNVYANLPNRPPPQERRVQRDDLQPLSLLPMGPSDVRPVVYPMVYATPSSFQTRTQGSPSANEEEGPNGPQRTYSRSDWRRKYWEERLAGLPDDNRNAITGFQSELLSSLDEIHVSAMVKVLTAFAEQLGEKSLMGYLSHRLKEFGSPKAYDVKSCGAYKALKEMKCGYLPQLAPALKHLSKYLGLDPSPSGLHHRPAGHYARALPRAE